MSQQHYPSQPPAPVSYGGYPTYPQTARPNRARRAGVMMWMLGGLAVFLFGSDGIRSCLLSTQQFHQQMVDGQQAMGTTAPPMMFSDTTLHVMSISIDFLVVMIGGTVLLLGFGVRKGRRGPTLAAVIVVTAITALLGLFAGLSLLAGFVTPAAFALALLLAIPLSLLMVLTFWLFLALRHSRPGINVMMPGHWQTAAAAPAMPAGYGVYPPPMAPSPAGLGYAYPGLTPPAPPRVVPPQLSPPQPVRVAPGSAE
jgi:hypothetical protein